MSEVKLVSITQPAIEGITSAEDLVAYVARVSNPGNQNNMLTAPKLIKYLFKNNHLSPFEMVHITLEINTTRDIARQVLRHRSFTFQEFSQRYADPTKDLGFERREARMQDKKNRQNSIDIVHEDGDRAQTLIDDWDYYQGRVLDASLMAYNWAIEKGIAKEQARAVLPEGLTHSRMYMSGSLRSWVHYIQLRESNGTQKEHMIIANQARKIIEPQFPALFEALREIEDEKTLKE